MDCEFFCSIGSFLYHSSAIIFLSIITTIIIAHIISPFLRKSPVKLNENSLVVIIGGCTGIGRIMANQIAKKYHSKIVVADLLTNRFQSLTKQLSKQNSLCQCFYCDLTDRQSVNKFIKHMNDKGTPIDLMIYNAGIMIPKLTWEYTNEERQKMFKVNFFSSIQMSLGLMELLKGGHLSIVASLASIIDGGRQNSIYIASKHAIYAYMNSFRQQLQKEKIPITVSIGCPYAIDTGMFDGYTTVLDFLFPMMDPNYVAKRLVRQFIKRKQVCFVYQYESIIFKLYSFMPTFCFDFMANVLDKSNFDKLRQKQDKQRKLKEVSEKKQ